MNGYRRPLYMEAWLKKRVTSACRKTNRVQGGRRDLSTLQEDDDVFV